MDHKENQDSFAWKQTPWYALIGNSRRKNFQSYYGTNGRMERYFLIRVIRLTTKFTLHFSFNIICVCNISNKICSWIESKKVNPFSVFNNILNKLLDPFLKCLHLREGIKNFCLKNLVCVCEDHFDVSILFTTSLKYLSQ